MAVRVKVEPKKSEVNCDHCGAVLEYIRSDIQSKEIEYQRSSETYYYIVCPVCNNKVYVQLKDEAVEGSRTASEVLEDVADV